MNQRKSALFGVWIMSVLLVLYFVYAVQRAIALFQSGTLLAITMGVAMLVLPLIGAWALLRELRFGREATRLVDELDRTGRVPVEEVETLPSGQPVREQAKGLLESYEAEVTANEQSWEAWARLGIMQDAAGDRTSARASLRRAISLRK
ncbi:hypothetical protein [Leucobacter chinensis]|uniref:hypothetical protein n=1 Tax=Leucobacter chinensis TaxID=2851010 RepID=UPI001C223005|nr:hypothetical protein [Leucobacter chinensis]